MTADYSPVYSGGLEPFTSTTSAAVTAGQILIVTGTGTVGPASAASGLVCGVAAQDAASGAKVTVWPIFGVVHESTCAAGATAGNALSSGANGLPVTGTLATLAAAGTLIGVALTTAGAGELVRWTGRG